MLYLLHLVIALGGLGVLSMILANIGRPAANCPGIAHAAYLGTWVVTSAFVTLGIGAIALTGAWLPLLLEGNPQRLFMPVGVVSIALGIGFFIAAEALCGILDAARGNLRAEAILPPKASS
ncbi:MAG: hypothetical protein AAGG06_05175 [Pseudomonadota bacterium]